MPPEQWSLPAPPAESLREGARWRWHRPSSADVASWFSSQPLDEGMEHEDYVGGVVLIGQSEKVKYTDPQGGQHERHEPVWVPYVQIGTRVGYFHRLAEHRGLIPVLEAAKVPKSTNPGSVYFNGNMVDGLWWHVVADGQGNSLRYLCATARVALYTPESYADVINGRPRMPVRAGEGTKQVGGGADPNGIAKAQTGAIGRALGVAGILVIGSGIASAEDMQELPGYGANAPGPEAATLPVVPSEIAAGEPPAVDPSEQLDSLRSRALALQTQLQEASDTNDPGSPWRQFLAWWRERQQNDGWSTLETVPLEGLKAIVSRMERQLAAGDS